MTFWKAFKAAAGLALGLAAGYLLVFLLLLLASTLSGCGGIAESPDDPDVAQPADEPLEVAEARQDVAQHLSGRREKHWCCAGDFDGQPLLLCGFEVRPENEMTCYCAGVVSANGEVCSDRTLFTPGTMCTQSDLVCW